MDNQGSYNGKKLKTYVKYIDPDFVGCTLEIYEVARPKMGVIDGSKLIIVGTAGEMEKLNLQNFDGFWKQEAMTYKEAFEKYGK